MAALWGPLAILLVPTVKIEDIPPVLLDPILP